MMRWSLKDGTDKQISRQVRSRGHRRPRSLRKVDRAYIDQNSSAELSEAINSMYSWYEASGLCYAYLVDVKDGVKDRDEGLPRFRESEWFRRGWTLQELLAPRKLHFVDREWRSIGWKEDLYADVSNDNGNPGWNHHLVALFGVSVCCCKDELGREAGNI
jgi:hypothetical protein